MNIKNMEIPKFKTRKEIIKKQREEGVPLLEILMNGLFGDLRNIPEYNDHDIIIKKACLDIKNRDYSDIECYIDDLYKLVEYYKELAEHYLEHIDKTKYIMDDRGYLEDLD